jgi:hypothetical protein
MVSALILRMTVSTGVEIGTGSRLEASQGQAPAKAQVRQPGTLWNGAAAANSASASATAAESFRSRWQSMLATLGAGTDEAVEETDEASEGRTAGGTDFATATAGAFAGRPSTLSSAALLERQGSSAAEGSEAGAATRTAAVIFSGDLSGQTRAPGSLQVEDRQSAPADDEARAGETRRAESVSGKSSATSTRATNLSKNTAQTADVSANAAAVAMASMTPLALQAPANTAAIARDASEQSDMPVHHYAALPEEAAENAGSQHEPQTGRYGIPSTQANRTGSNAADGTTATAMQGRDSAKDALSVAPSGAQGASHDESDPADTGGAASRAGGGQDATVGGAGQGITESRPVIAGTSSSLSAPHAQSTGTESLAIAAPPAVDGSNRVAVEGATSSGASSLTLASGALEKSEKARAAQSAVSAHGAGSSTTLHATYALAGQTATSTTLDATAMTRDLAGARGAGSVAGGSAMSATASTAAPTVQDTFAALDAGTTTASPYWMHAGTQRAEAGYQDPALGWIGVRAELGGGGIHAALVPGSADAAVTLGGHLTGLNSYLNEQHTPVESLTLDGSAEQGAGSGAGQGMQQGAGQQTGQGAPAEPASNRAPGSASVHTVSAAEAAAQIGQPETGGPGSADGGKYVSVMA